MKAFIGSIDWADEGDVFFFSVMSDSRLEGLKELINVFTELDRLGGKVEMYWGTNEWFNFDWSDLESFIEEAIDLSEEELAVFKKFHIRGFDIYDRIMDQLYWIAETSDLDEEELAQMKPAFLKVFTEKDWDTIQP